MSIVFCAASLAAVILWFVRAVWSARGALARAGRCVAVPTVLAAHRHQRPMLMLLFLLVASPFGADLFATTTDEGPWAVVGEKLCDLFFNTLGKALAIVAVVIGGLMYAFGEGGSKSQIAGLAFGAGMVLMAPGFLDWILDPEDTITGC